MNESLEGPIKDLKSRGGLKAISTFLYIFYYLGYNINTSPVRNLARNKRVKNISQPAPPALAGGAGWRKILKNLSQRLTSLWLAQITLEEIRPWRKLEYYHGEKK